jgi:hypothetical protein
MEGLWISIGFLIGALIVYLLIHPRVKRAESEADTERFRANGADELRQKLEVEVSSLREVATRVDDLVHGGRS